MVFREPDQRGNGQSSQGGRKECPGEVRTAPPSRAAWEFPRQEWVGAGLSRGKSGSEQEEWVGAAGFQADRAIDEKALGLKWAVSVVETAGDSFHGKNTSPRKEASKTSRLEQTDQRGPVILQTEIHVNSVGNEELLSILNKRLIQYVI